jgi:hypothetical protein
VVEKNNEQARPRFRQAGTLHARTRSALQRAKNECHMCSLFNGQEGIVVGAEHDRSKVFDGASRRRAVGRHRPQMTPGGESRTRHHPATTNTSPAPHSSRASSGQRRSPLDRDSQWILDLPQFLLPPLI